MNLPELNYNQWQDTKATLHLTTQIMGKIKLLYHPKLNHWWHLTLHLTPNGVSTLSIPYQGQNFEIELNVHKLTLEGKSSQGVEFSYPLQGKTIADVYHQLVGFMRELGLKKDILDKPYDNPHSQIPFSKDREHKSWDHQAIKNWWQILLFVEEAFKIFAGQSFCKTSPAHLFWHSFDYVVTRFSGHPVNLEPNGSRRSDVEAYSHEVVSFGFWPGDPKVQFPAFYSYTSPEPKGIEKHALFPKEAWWEKLEASHLAMLKYDDLRKSQNPTQTLIDFMKSANDGGCKSENWKEEGTLKFWDSLDEKFPVTKNREHR